VWKNHHSLPAFGVIKKVMFMKRIIFKRYPDGDYWPIKYVSLELDILINFLATDVGLDGAKYWIEWLKNLHRQYPVMGGNLTYLTENSDVPDEILIGDALTEDEIYFCIKKQKLIELLTTWEKLNQEKPNFIVVTIDGENIAMTGHENIWK
jgi:hypothetical protein